MTGCPNCGGHGIHSCDNPAAYCERCLLIWELIAEIAVCRQRGYFDLADDAREWLRSKGIELHIHKDQTITWARK